MSDNTCRRSIVLASGSPRRRDLLNGMGIRFTVFEPQADENIDALPRDKVLLLALRKADAACPQCPDAIVITADTLVALDGETLGKPRTDDEARAMLRRLSGRTHEVLTGLCVTDTRTGERRACVASTSVRFRDLTDGEIADYVAGGEPRGKAGAYAIQGAGGAFVESIQGSRNNVIGLPTETLKTILDEMI